MNNRQPDPFAKVPPIIMVALVAFFCLAPVALHVGCATGKGQLTPSTGVYDPNVMASTLVVTAENVRELALDAFDNFARLERANRAALMKVDPKIHQAAETVRRDGKKYLDALTAAKVAFQNDRSQANATALTSALASVQSLLRDTVRYISEIATKKGTP
jgi:hypothetical protein